MSAHAHSRTPIMTPEAFLAWESEQADRHEFIHGEIYAMTGGTLRHAAIAGNCLIALKSRLLPRGCQVYQSEAKVHVDGNFFYPDVVAQCSQHEMIDQVVPQPVVIVEVLSPSTEKYDQLTKWPLYQSLPGLRTFLLVHQDRVQVQLYRRSGDAWTYTLHQSLADVLELSEPALTLPVRELYAGVRGLDPAHPAAT
jgi:Uma2 family endonuclease